MNKLFSFLQDLVPSWGGSTKRFGKTKKYARANRNCLRPHLYSLSTRRFLKAQAVGKFWRKRLLPVWRQRIA